MVDAMTIDAQLATLSAAGFDIAHPFDAQAAARDGWEVLAGEARLGVLIGNTRALWPVFTAAIKDPGPDPLDHYTETTLSAAFPTARIWYAHRPYAESFLPFQKLAVATGLGALSDGGLVIHPIYGPWLALRAVVVLDGEPIARASIAKPCTCDARCATTLAAARESGDWRAWLAVRDSCTLRDHRYGEDQIRYHYTKAWGGDLGGR